MPGEIKITVTDTGPGVLPEYIPQLFRAPIVKGHRKGTALTLRRARCGSFFGA